MKRILIAIALLLPLSLMAQDRYDIPQTGTKIGLTRTGINSNFVFLFIAGTNSFRTTVEKGSNINFVAKSPTNATQLDYCLTNMTSDGNTPQGPWTNWIAGATWGVSNAGTYGFADTNTILFTLGTNRFVIQGGATTPTNLAWNGYSLINPDPGWAGTNLLPLAFGAGNTATILRADTFLGRPFKADLTSTPASITFEAGWPTNEIGDAFVSFFKGTNSLTMVGATIIDSGRASSTNVLLSSTSRTEVLFHKALGESKFNVIQLVP